MLEKQSVFTSIQILQHSEYFSDYFCPLFIDFEGCYLSSTEFLAFFTWILYFVFSFSGTTAEENALSVIIVVWYVVFLEDGWLNSSRPGHLAQIPS